MIPLFLKCIGASAVLLQSYIFIVDSGELRAPMAKRNPSKANVWLRFRNDESSIVRKSELTSELLSLIAATEFSMAKSLVTPRQMKRRFLRYSQNLALEAFSGPEMFKRELPVTRRPVAYSFHMGSLDAGNISDERNRKILSPQSKKGEGGGGQRGYKGVAE